MEWRRKQNHRRNNLLKVKIFSTLQLHHLILAFIIHNQIIFVYIRKYIHALLPARASEQGNLIGSVRIYIFIYVCVQKKIVIERTRDLIYLKFVATDFFPKIISPSAGKNSGDLA